MEPTATGTDEMWDDFQRGVEQIYVDREHLTVARYMSLYSYARNLMNAIRVFDSNRRHVTFYDLYKYVEAFLRNHVTTLFDAANSLMKEDLLRLYSIQWEHFKCSSEVLSHVVPIVNQERMTKYWPEGTEKVYGTYQLALLTWRDMLLSASGAKVIDGVLALIEDERRGESIDISLVRGVLFSYVDLSLIDEDPARQQPKLEVYQTAFEGRLLKSTERFYERVEEELFEKNTVSEYVKNVEKLLAEEERRVERYMHASTRQPVLNTLWEVLVKNHLDALYAEFEDLLRKERHDDIARRYLLLSCSGIALDKLAAMFEEHVTAQGLLAVERLGDTLSKDPSIYVDTLMHVYRKYNDIVLTTFASNGSFVYSFSRACTKFINRNAVALSARSSRKSPEFFAVYFDTVISKWLQGPHHLQFDHGLDGVVPVLKYIDDKDVFKKCLTETLAKRLVQLSISEDMEAILVDKLRVACGDEYVSKLKLMFRDMAASKEVNEKFMAHIKNSDEGFKPDLNIHVLTSGLWPFRQSSELQLPQELEGIVQCYTTFYSRLHSTRKLRWLHNLSNGELETSCFEKDYTLEASTFQMAVLVQYNFRLSFTLQQLLQGTGMDMGILQQVLQSLLKCKLLICQEDDSKDCGKLRPDTVVSLFEGFNNQKQRVNINVPLKKELDADQGVTQKMIYDDRKMLVQATIVRTIKVRKTFKHEELIVEIKSQLQPKFEPTKTLINECINKLIDMEYLEKDDGQPNTYKYLA